MSTFTIYHHKNDNEYRVYIVPNHYNHSVKYIRETLELCKGWGLTVPDEFEVKVEVLRGERHKGQLSIEFTSITPPVESDVVSLSDLDLYPHLNRWLVY